MTLWPRSFVGRTTAATVASLAAAQLLTFAAFTVFVLIPQTQRVAEVMAQSFVVVTVAAERASPAERAALIAELDRSDYVEVWSDGEPVTAAGLRPRLLERLFMRTLVEKLPRQRELDWLVDRSGRLWLHVALGPDYHWLSIAAPRGLEPALTLFVALLVTLILALASALAAQRRLARPLGALAGAVADLRPGAVARTLPEDGPTELAALSRGFNRLTERLAAGERDRAIMLAGVSHDVRTPLAKLRLAVEMLASEEDELGRTARRQIAEIDRILGQFLIFARGQEGEAELVFELDALVSEVAAAQAAEGLEVIVGPARAGPVRGRPEALRRALLNLIRNAQRHGRPPVGLTAERLNGEVRLVVRDAGPGVPDHLLQQVIQPFARAEVARGGPEGAGLGLAIVAQTAAAHGGRLTLRNLTPAGFEAELRWPDGRAV